MARFELQEAPTGPTEAPAGPVSPDKSWSPLERWIWEKLQAGEIANIDEYEDEHGRLPSADPRKPEDWQDGRRRISPRFLEDLLLRDPYRSGLHRKGVCIEAAWLDEAIDLSMAELARPLLLDRCRFEKAADLKYLQTPAPVSLDYSAFAAELDLQGACIGADLFMHSGAAFNDVILRGAKIGQVSLIGARVTGTLYMESADIGQNLLMRSDRSVSEQRAEFNEVVLTGAKIGGQMDLTGAKVVAKLEINSAEIGQSLLMATNRSVSEQRAEFNDVILNSARVRGQLALIGAKVAGTLEMDSANIGQSLLLASDHQVSEQRAEFNDVVLNGAKIGGQVSLIGAKVVGTLEMEATDIGQNLLMTSDRSVSEHVAEFVGGADLIFAKVGRNLDVTGAILSNLDLSGTRICGELRLASPLRSPLWQDACKLVLRNASVDAIQDASEEGAWPPVVELDGFSYQRFGGFGADAEQGVAKRGSRWFIDWLARDEPYTPQPYQQCAQVLRGIGHPEMASDVLYAGRECERKEAWRTGNNPRGTGLTLLKWFVGYGYGQRLLWRPLACVAVLVAAGTAVLHLAGVPKELAGSEAAVVAYSLDTLLPIVELEKSFGDIVLHGFAKYYFYFQKLMGWVLASFLIAGLSGLTK